MSNLIDKIQNFEYYEKEFDTWEPTEIIIDENCSKEDIEYFKQQINVHRLMKK